MNEDLEKRVRDLERAHDITGARLEGGAKAFNDLRKDIDALTERVSPKPLPIWQIIVTVFGMLGTVLGVWWTARGELDSKADRQDVQHLQTEQNEHKVILTKIKVSQEAMTETVKEIKDDVRAMRRGR